MYLFGFIIGIQYTNSGNVTYVTVTSMLAGMNN